MSFTALLAAVCAGISCGCLGFLFLKRFSSMELEKRDLIREKRVPLVFKVVLPLLGLTRPLASSNSCALWRKREQVKLEMAGYSIVFSSAFPPFGQALL